MTKKLEVDLEGLRNLQKRIEAKELEATDWLVFSTLIANLADRAEAKLSRMIAKILADEAATIATSPTLASTDLSAPEDGHSADKAAAGSSGDGQPATEDHLPSASEGTSEGQTKPKGHGRGGASSYSKATHVHHPLAPGLLASLCQACKAGPMSKYREKLIIRIVGQPLFGAEIHHFEQARCKLCGRILRAAVPQHVNDGLGSNYITYHWTACAMLGVMHYVAGMPFKRLESLQKGWGIPLPDANQWQIVNESDNLLLPLSKALEQHAIDHAISLKIDDTGSKVIELQRQINAETKALEEVGRPIDEVRTGINATGVYIETAEGTVTLYYTGLHHAGEIFDRLLARRRNATGEKLATVTDGASKNFSHDHKEGTNQGVCNAHALLKFRDIKDKFPEEYAVAGAAYKQIFDNDDVAKARAMTPNQRRDFHKEHSLPLLKGLKAMCEEKIKGRLVEPRSPLWQALIFIVNQWPRLSKFCEEPGVPLDTNLVEQSLIIPVRYLSQSFNYQTTTGAEVGDRHMSLVVTAIDNEVEPVSYLAHCLENHEDLKKRPHYYLPWVYRERLEAAEDALMVPPD